MSNCMYTAYGDFVCKEDTKEHFNDLPPSSCNNCPDGEYLNTCIDCSLNNKPSNDNILNDRLLNENILKCKCTRKIRSSITKPNTQLNLNMCQNNNLNIKNDNGKLICNKNHLPPGPYNTLCRDCSFYKNIDNTNNKLICRCKDINNNFMGTTLDNCFENNIEVVDNGQLVCK